MWSNVISIDKRYSNEVDYLISSVKNIKDLSFAIEESKDRIWIYLASICALRDDIEEEITCLLEDVILTYMKTQFFLDRLPRFQLNHATCSLICSLVHFDRSYEVNQLCRAIAETADFNVDGLYNFRLQELKQNWEEVVDLASRLMASTDSDSYDIAAFITSTDGAKSRLVLKQGRLVNVTTGKEVKILPIFDSFEFNLIMAIIGESPSEIVVDDNFSKDMRDTLKHIATLC